MSPSRSEEHDLFNRCRQLNDVRQRELLLEQACADNSALRDRVRELLAAYEAAPEFLEPSPSPSPDAVTAPIPDIVGTHIGPYQLTRLLGHGGMGIVYLARQSEPVRRLVAIKIIRPGLESENLALRFEAERQALAVMDHPGIAKVLDAGVTESGRPYFVMEYIDGVSITKFCDEQQMTVPDRLRLFQSVCEAVQHAHRKGLIHRDLKPSNILVSLQDGQPVPKVIDFGVAKAIDQKLTSETIYTTYGQFVGTLEYMSPEQARHDLAAIDIRTDVYGLGVLLYELLSGVTPFDPRRLREVSFDELLRILCNEEPPSPTQRLANDELATAVAAARGAEPVQLRRQLSRELEWIVLKSISKSPTRRYGSPQELADEIGRFLSGQTIVARSPRPIDRVVKLVRRRPAVTALVIVLILAIAGFAGGLVLHSSRLTAALDVARATAYGATIHNAWLAYENNDFTSFREWIGRYRDGSGLEQYRGIEWDFLDHLMPRKGREIANLGYDVYVAVYTPDGRSMALVGESPRLVILDAQTGEVRFNLQTSQQEINGVTFDPDEPRLWYTGYDGTIHEVNYQTNQPGYVISAHPGEEAFEVLYDPQRRLLVSCGSEKTIRLWDAATGDSKGTLDGHSSTVQTLHWLSDGRRFLSASNDGTAILWDLETRSSIRRYQASVSRLLDIAVTTDQRYFSTCSVDGYVTLFDLETGAVLDEAYFSDLPTRLTFSQDGRELAVIDRLGNLRIFEMAERRPGRLKLVRTEAWAFQTDRAYGLDRSPSGEHLVTTCQEGRVLVWDNPWTINSSTVDLASPEVENFQFDSSSRRIIAVGNGIRMFDLTSGSGSAPVEEGREIRWLTVAPDGRHFVAADGKGLLTIHEAEGCARIAERQFSPPGFLDGALSISRDSRILLVAERRGQTVYLLDAQTADLRHTLSVQDSRLAICSPAADRFVVTESGNDLSMRTVSAPEGIVWRKSLSPRDVTCLRFSPDGRMLLAASDRVIHCLDAETGMVRQELRGHMHEVKSLDVSPDGRTIASLDAGGLLKLWQPANGQLLIEIQVTPRPGGQINLCWFAPDGRWLAHTQGRHTIRLIQFQFP